MKTQSATKLRRTLDPNRNPQVFLPLNKEHIRLINDLLKTGVWGNTAAQVVMRLFDSACAAQLALSAPKPSQ